MLKITESSKLDSQSTTNKCNQDKSFFILWVLELQKNLAKLYIKQSKNVNFEYNKSRLIKH